MQSSSLVKAFYLGAWESDAITIDFIRKLLQEKGSDSIAEGRIAVSAFYWITANLGTPILNIDLERIKLQAGGIVLIDQSYSEEKSDQSVSVLTVNEENWIFSLENGFLKALIPTNAIPKMIKDFPFLKGYRMTILFKRA